MKGVLPDLILIDGGKGQLAAAGRVLDELQLSVPMVGVAKGPERKAGWEVLHLRDGRELRLAADNPGLHLIQQIRDEAHRFAITGHRRGAGVAVPSRRWRRFRGSVPNVASNCCASSVGCAKWRVPVSRTCSR